MGVGSSTLWCAQLKTTFFPTEVANSSYAGGVNVNDHVDIDHNLQLFSKKVFCFNKEVQTSVS